MIQRLVMLEESSKVLDLKCKELEETVLVQKEEIARLRSEGISRTVFVEVKLPTKQTFADGDTVIFTHPTANVGNAYHTDFGFFEPPLDGTYSFSATMCTYPDTWIVFGLMKDNDVLDEIIVGDTSWHQCGTSTAVPYVTTRNKVWVKVLRTRHGIVDKDYGISSFTAVLLNTLSP